MVPPANRRPGYSRRAQYGTFFGYVIAFAGLAAGVLLLVVAVGGGTVFGGARGVAADAAAPAGALSARARSEANGLLATIGGYFTLGSRVARMERELAVARVALAEAAAVRNENRQLRALLRLSAANPAPVTAALLIGSTAASTRRLATLGAGSWQGVRAGMPVRTPEGLIGRVLDTGETTARVLLITDSESVVPVRRARDGVPATAIGKGDGTLQLKLVTPGTNPLRGGDAFVTSGSGGLFWPGMAVAVVTAITADGAIARPLSDPGTSEYAAVLPVWTETVNAAPPPRAAPKPGPG